MFTTCRCKLTCIQKRQHNDVWGIYMTSEWKKSLYKKKKDEAVLVQIQPVSGKEGRWVEWEKRMREGKEEKSVRVDKWSELKWMSIKVERLIWICTIVEINHQHCMVLMVLCSHPPSSFPGQCSLHYIIVEGHDFNGLQMAVSPSWYLTTPQRLILERLI